MKSCFCLIIALLLCNTGFSQQVIYSSYERFDLRNGDYSVVGKIAGRSYTYRASADGYYLDAWDDSMHRLATIVLDFFPSKIYETRFYAYNDRIIILYQGSERGKITQYAARLDANGRLQGKPLVLADAKTGIFGPSGNYFSSAVSEDKHYIMVYSDGTRGRKVKVAHTLLDDELKIVERAETDWEAENEASLRAGLLDNQGNFYIPVFTTTGSRDYADGIWMLNIPRGRRAIRQTIELPLNSKYASGMYFRLDNQSEKLYSAGFYSERKAGNYDGILFARFDISNGDLNLPVPDASDSASSPSLRRIQLDERLRTSVGGRSNRTAFNDFQTRQLIIRNDGGFVLVAEDYYMSVRAGGVGPYGYYTSYYSPFVGAQNIREFHYGDILALSYNLSGQREWNSIIRKDQYSQEDAGVFSSYTFVNTGGALGFLYNDFDTRRSRINVAVINADGQIDTHHLDAAGAADPDWLPRAGKQVSARELIVPCLRKRQICFAKVVF